MKRHFTYSQACAGELAARNLSEKAKAFFDGSDDIHIYEVEDAKGKAYYLGIGSEIKGPQTLSKIQKELEQYQDEADDIVLEMGHETFGPSVLLGAKRRLVGLTQKQLAEKAGISIRTIQAYEQGQKDFGQAAVQTVLKIARALGFTVEELIEETEPEWVEARAVLPKGGRKVLVVKTDGEPDVAWIDGGKWMTGAGEIPSSRIRTWRELPPLKD